MPSIDGWRTEGSPRPIPKFMTCGSLAVKYKRFRLCFAAKLEFKSVGGEQRVVSERETANKAVQRLTFKYSIPCTNSVATGP